MRKEYAIFNGRKLVAKYWTEAEARQCLQSGQHIRRWNWGWDCKRPSWVLASKWGE